MVGRLFFVGAPNLYLRRLLNFEHLTIQKFCSENDGWVGHSELAVGVFSFAWADATWDRRSLGLLEIRSFCVCFIVRIRGVGLAAWEEFAGLSGVRSGFGCVFGIGMVLRVDFPAG